MDTRGDVEEAVLTVVVEDCDTVTWSEVGAEELFDSDTWATVLHEILACSSRTMERIMSIKSWSERSDTCCAGAWELPEWCGPSVGATVAGVILGAVVCAGAGLPRRDG